MNSKGEASMAKVFMLIVVAMFAMVSMPFILSSSAFIATETAPAVQDNITLTFDGNWAEEGMLNNLVEDGQGDLTLANAGTGNWTSVTYDYPRNRILDVMYEANLNGGSGNITVNAWLENPETTSPDQSRTIRMNQGVEEEVLDYAQYNYFQFVITLEDQSSSEGLTEVDSFSVDFQIEEELLRGVEDSQLTVMIFLVVLFGLISLIVGLAYIEEE